MKSFKKRIEEGRCQGIGAEYVPFITSREARSRGTASSIYDAIEGRLVHTLSTTETWAYYKIRWDPDVIHIREQYLLDTDRMRKIGKEFGVKCGDYYTTDFLVDYKDGSQRAYSVKYSRREFDENNPKYFGNEKAFSKLVIRQAMEKLYWESQGVAFSIITREDINLDYVINISNVMSFYDEFRVVSREHKLMYLIAHRYVIVPMDKMRLNFKKLADKATFDIDDLYEKVQLAREVYSDE